MAIARGLIQARMSTRVSGIRVVYNYEIYRTDTKEVLYSGSASPGASALRLKSLDAQRWKAHDIMLGMLRKIRDYHEPNKELSRYSLADLVSATEWWSYERTGKDWLLSHPLSGQHRVTFKAKWLDARKMPTVLGVAKALLQILPSPPRSISAVSKSNGQLDVACGSVKNAKNYGFYHDNGDGTFTELSVALTNDLTAVPVDPGDYRVRAAGIAADGTVGLLSPVAEVEVG